MRRLRDLFPGLAGVSDCEAFRITPDDLRDVWGLEGPALPPEMARDLELGNGEIWEADDAPEVYVRTPAGTWLWHGAENEMYWGRLA